MLALLILTLRAQPHGCKAGSRFEDCEEYIECLAYPPNCTKLVIEDDPTDPDGGSRNIIGTMPTAIGNLTALTNLVISENGVSGTIPETLGLLTMLEALQLCSAPTLGDLGRLSGTLPPSLGNLTRLEFLFVYATQLSGTLPPSLGELTALLFLEMFTNSFTGVIPETFSKLTALAQLDLSQNHLSGTLSETIGELTALTVLDLDNNQISGTLPVTTGELTALAQLILFNNDLSGTLSETIGALTALTRLFLDRNNFTGTLSETIGELTALTQLDVSDNRMSGTVPDILADLTSLQLLYLQNNYFTELGGGICSIQDHLTMGCDLSNNAIPGTSTAKGGKTNCPVCLNDGNCNKHNQGPGGDQPIFPNKACDFTRSSCTCLARSPTPAPSPTTAPTLAPTTMSHAAHRWKQYDTTLVVIFAVLIGAVLILTFVVVYETIVISRNACRDSKLRGTPYTGALGRALTNRCCWCYTKTEFADTVAVLTDSTLNAPFLLDVEATAESTESTFIFSPQLDREEVNQPRREILREVVANK